MWSMMGKKRIGIIGWGAAGMMAAATIVERFETGLGQVKSTKESTSETWEQELPHIILFEKNKELWTKVRISGGGRCNVTTGYYKKQDLQNKYTRGREFLSHAMGQFWPRKMTQRCEFHGVPLTCEADMRVFPTSNTSHDIVNIFERIIDWYVDIHFNEWVTSVQKNVDNTFTLTTSVNIYTVDILVVTTWGNAYTHTWSAWDGYTIARQFWHTITQIGPSLNSFLVAEDRSKNVLVLAFRRQSLRPVSRVLHDLFYVRILAYRDQQLFHIHHKSPIFLYQLLSHILFISFLTLIVTYNDGLLD
jgi:predicted flavoprotein YhiN